MATAAVTDAFYKDRRRSRLDVEIAEAKAKLTKLMEISQSSDLARLYETSHKLNDKYLDYPQEKGDPLHSFATTPRARLYYNTYHLQREDIYLSREQKELFPRWNFEYSARLDSLRICRRALRKEDNEEQAVTILDRQPRNEIQWKHMEDRLNKLVDDLLLASYRTSEAEAFNQNTGPSSPKSPHEMIRRLRAEGYPSYQHPKLDKTKTGQLHTRLNELNQSNLDALARWGLEARQLNGRREHYVARICYNLLVSEVPPGISSYNHLMLGFMELGELELANVVADSFLLGSRLKPTRTTILCLLQLARLKQGAWRFQKLAMRILGYHEKGILIRRRKLDLIPKDQMVARWARNTQVVAAGDWAVELPEINWSYYGVFLEAFLDFNLLRNAVDVFLYSIRGDYAPNGNAVRRLLHALIASADGSLIRHAVAGMLHNVEALTNMLYDQRFDTWTSSIARKIRTLLAFRSCDHISKIFDREKKSLIEAADARTPVDTNSDFEAFVKAFDGNDPKGLTKVTNTTSNNHHALCAITEPQQQPPTPRGDALDRLVFATWVVCLKGELRALRRAIEDVQKVLDGWNVLKGLGRRHTIVKRNRPERAKFALKLFNDAAQQPRNNEVEIEAYHLAGTVLWVKKVLKEREKRIAILDKRVRRVMGRIGQRRGEPPERWQLPPRWTTLVDQPVVFRSRARSKPGQQQDQKREVWEEIQITKPKTSRAGTDTPPVALSTEAFKEMMCTMGEARVL